VTRSVYAPDHIYTEVYRRLPKIARSTPVPLDALRERFEAEYLPALRYVTVDTAAIADPQVLAITDPDDVPTGQLAKLIAPCVVFSEDRHLRKPGLAPPAWRDAAQFAVDLAAGVTGQRITGNLTTLPFRGGAELVAFLSRKTGVSPWIIGGIATAAAACVLSSPQRRQTVGRYVMPVVEALMKEMERSTALEQHGIAGLRQILLAAPQSPMPSSRPQSCSPPARRAAACQGGPAARPTPLPRRPRPHRHRATGRPPRWSRVRAARALPLAVRPRGRAVAGALSGTGLIASFTFPAGICFRGPTAAGNPPACARSCAPLVDYGNGGLAR
jgi:hypothetical protein